MIKVSVMYPHRVGTRFDHDYYRDTHLPLAGATPGSPPTYVGMCHFFCESPESFQAAFGPHAQEILGDIPNYTDLEPVLQIAEVVVEHS